MYIFLMEVGYYHQFRRITWEIPFTDASATEFVPAGQDEVVDMGMYITASSPGSIGSLVVCLFCRYFWVSFWLTDLDFAST